MRQDPRNTLLGHLEKLSCRAAMDEAYVQQLLLQELGFLICICIAYSYV